MATNKLPKGQQIVRKGTKQWWCSVLLLLGAYTMLIPGILMNHIHFKYTYSRVPILDDSYGIVVIIDMLWKAGGTRGHLYKLMSCFITLWGICIPTVKLGTLLTFLSGFTRSRFGVEVVCKVSKWAFVDAFIPVIWASAWASPEVHRNVKDNGATATVELQPGVYFFLCHLIFAQLVNHLVLLLPMDDASLPLLEPHEEPQEKHTTSSHSFRAAASAFGILTMLLIALVYPIMGFKSNQIGIDTKVSALNLVGWLNLEGLWLPAVAATIFAVVCPISDLILGFLKATAGVDLPQTLFWVETFAMFDVFMTAIAISCLACPVFFTGLISLRLTIAGYLAWLFYTAWAFIALFRPSHVDLERPWETCSQ